MRAAAPLVLVLLLAGCVAPPEAGGDAAVPLVYAPGADAAAAGLALAADGASFTAALRGVPDATVTYGELVTLTNVDARTRVATLAAPRVADPGVLAYRLDWMDGGVVVATLDLKADAPEATLDVPPGRTLAGRATLTLAGEPGPGPVAIATSVR